MRQAAYSVESRLPDEERFVPTPDVPAHTGERLLLVLTADPSSAALIRRGRRVADYLRADCLAVYVAKQPDFRDLSDEARQSLERNLNFARGLRIDTRVLQGDDTAETIANFARLHGVTQMFVTRQKSSAIQSWFASALVQRLVNHARDMQVTVVADRSRRPATT
jgi:two-component system sensor histidine kinase KdpD